MYRPARTGERGEPMATPEVCWNAWPSNMKGEVVTQRRMSLRKGVMGMGSGRSPFSCCDLMKTRTSSRGTEVKREVTSKLRSLPELGWRGFILDMRSSVCLRWACEKEPRCGERMAASHLAKG